MLKRTSVALVDSNPRRRAHISLDCARLGVHVEPFEGPDELLARDLQWTIFIHDQDRWLDEVIAGSALQERAVPVIAFAEAARSPKVVEAVLAGALDYLEWPFDARELVASLKRVSLRSAFVLEQRERTFVAAAKLSKLSNRERDVLNAMSEGLTNKQIGRHLQISPRTVEIHRSHALGKLGVESSVAAIRLALQSAQRGH